MARISCPECKRQISETAEACPKCGYKLTPEEAAEVKKKEKDTQKAIAIGCLVVFLFPVLIVMCSQLSPKSSKVSHPTPTYRQETTKSVDYYKNQYREARRVYETTKSNYDQNPSVSNKQTWDDAANKLDRAYLRLEKAMGAEPHKGVTKQRKELEAFIRRVKSEAK